MDKLEKALREMVKRIYTDCNGAYGGDYEGQYEREIKAVAKAIKELIAEDNNLE